MVPRKGVLEMQDATPAERPVTLAVAERRHILAVLAHTKGNRGEAAKILGIDPATLWRRLKKYGKP